MVPSAHVFLLAGLPASMSTARMLVPASIWSQGSGCKGTRAGCCCGFLGCVAPLTEPLPAGCRSPETLSRCAVRVECPGDHQRCAEVVWPSLVDAKGIRAEVLGGLTCSLHGIFRFGCWSGVSRVSTLGVSKVYRSAAHGSQDVSLEDYDELGESPSNTGRRFERLKMALHTVTADLRERDGRRVAVPR